LFVLACGSRLSFFFVDGCQVFTSFGGSFFSGFVLDVVLFFDVVAAFPAFGFEGDALPEPGFVSGGFFTGLELASVPPLAFLPFSEGVSPVLAGLDCPEFVLDVVLSFGVVAAFPALSFEDDAFPEPGFDSGGFSAGLEFASAPPLAFLPFPEAVSPILFFLLLLQ
jgi:hypothetical protein